MNNVRDTIPECSKSIMDGIRIDKSEIEMSLHE